MRFFGYLDHLLVPHTFNKEHLYPASPSMNPTPPKKLQWSKISSALITPLFLPWFKLELSKTRKKTTTWRSILWRGGIRRLYVAGEDAAGDGNAVVVVNLQDLLLVRWELGVYVILVDRLLIVLGRHREEKEDLI